MKISKIKIFALILFLAVVFLNVNFHYVAATGIGDAFNTEADMPLDAAARQGAGFNTNVTFEFITGAIITSVLSLMGVLFLILAIYGGYAWMTARGNEEAVEKAKDTLTNAIIGLVIVLAAYAISYFVLSQISSKVLK
jgi:tetrahydromethanopterin S-methyltransferase subunit B